MPRSKLIIALLLTAAICAACSQSAAPQPSAATPSSQPAQPVQPAPGKAPTESESPESGQQPQGSMRLPNPIAPIESEDGFSRLGFAVTAPEGAQDISYSIIADTTAQAGFTLEGKTYIHRAAEGMQWQMLSGIYESFEEQTKAIKLEDGEATLLTIAEKGGRLGHWQSGEISYTLYTADAASDEEMTSLIKLLDEASRNQR